MYVCHFLSWPASSLPDAVVVAAEPAELAEAEEEVLKGIGIPVSPGIVLDSYRPNMEQICIKVGCSLHIC